jgi:hypothetical protein
VLSVIPRSNNAKADVFSSHSIGHILSSNNHTLSKGQMSVGTLYAGVGITDLWTLGISPFAASSFSMISLSSRAAVNISPSRRVGFQTDYYKTYGQESDSDRYFRTSFGRYPFGFDSFEMEAWTAKLTASEDMSEIYRLSITASYFYYINDERPFSLRMDPQNSDRYSVNLTSLHEIKFSDIFYISGECGFWGINYTYPYVHSGLTFGIQGKNWLIALGASTTFSPQFPREKRKNFAGYASTLSIHPEFQVQLFF